MTRPTMIRADTMDLQSRQSPSAANHVQTSDSSSPRGMDPSQSADMTHIEHELLTDRSDIATISGSTIAERDYDGQTISGSTLYSDDGTDDEDGDDDLLSADFDSTSPSIDNEDIDFEFVYALHSFTATVEGQANALKGDTMVLLDDSNSYWWLVRIVKDSSIGYLPAEHIETPTERLARLNKHRNIDLCQSQLSDVADTEKPRGALDNIFGRGRKKPKNVVFTSPFSTTVEYYEVESSEDEMDGEGYHNDEEEGEEGEEGESHEDADEITVADRSSPVKEDPKQKKKEEGPAIGKITIVNDQTRDADVCGRVTNELDKVERESKPQKKPDLSIFADDARIDSRIETKKITLTPQVARGDDNSSNSGSPINTTSGLKDFKSRGSLEKSHGREQSPPPGKKDKGKKGGVLGNLFKKRKGKKADDDLEDFLHPNNDKNSSDIARENGDHVREDDSGKKAREGAAAQRDKDEKDRENENENESDDKALEQQRERDREVQRKYQQRQLEQQRQREQDRRDAMAAEQVVSERRQRERSGTNDSTRRNSPPKEESPIAAQQQPQQQAQQQQQSQPQQQPILSGSQPKPLRLVTGRNGSLDDKHSFTRSESPKQYKAYSPEKRAQIQQERNNSRQAQYTYKTSLTSQNSQSSQSSQPSTRLSESPEELTYEDAESAPGLVHDNQSDDGAEISSPEIIDSTGKDSPNKSPTPTWSDVGLRNFFDDGNTEVQEMLARIHDTSDMPVVTEHPLVTPMYSATREKLADINSRLDSLFMSFLKSRGRA